MSGVTDPNTYYQPERLAQTQAELARVPEVGQRVITAAGLTDRTPAGFLGSSSVVAEPDSDLIDFTVVDTDRATAAKLANTMRPSSRNTGASSTGRRSSSRDRA